MGRILFEFLRFKHCISSLTSSGSVTSDAQEKSNEIGFGESMRAPFFWAFAVVASRLTRGSMNCRETKWERKNSSHQVKTMEQLNDDILQEMSPSHVFFCLSYHWLWVKFKLRHMFFPSLHLHTINFDFYKNNHAFSHQKLKDISLPLART